MTAAQKLIIFGTGAFAERAGFYFDNFSDHLIACFSVDARHRSADTFGGLPVIPFEEIAERYRPQDHDLFAAVGYGDMNRTRQRICLEAGRLGYDLASFIAPSAVIHASTLGPGSIVFDNASIGPFVTAGPGTVVASNAMIGHHSTIGDFTYVSGGVTISGGCRIGSNAFIGAGSVLRDGITVCDQAFVGMGSVVTRDIVEPGTYAGNPAGKLR